MLAENQARLISVSGLVHKLVEDLPIAHVFGGHVVVEHRRLPFFVAGFETGGDFEENDAEAEHVDESREKLLRQEFLRQVRSGAKNHGQLFKVVALPLPRQPKVANFRNAARIEENVSRLYVAVNQRLVGVPMKILEAPERDKQKC